MSLYAIADTHFSFGVDKPMDAFGGWQDYVTRLEKNWRALVSENDTTVIAGDISWGMNFDESLPDFQFIESLPGKKLILKGNHDYWWNTRKKMESFLSLNNFNSISIIHNSSETVGDVCVCGSRGWFFDDENEDKKILNREAGRLIKSLESAGNSSFEKVVFLHYPPIYKDSICEEIVNVLVEFNVKRCYYGHIHSSGIKWAFNGVERGIKFELISCDYTEFTPKLIQKSVNIADF